ncbi:MAG: phosphotransferase family protein [Halieaceae bacterium]|nr:phosphotransferase family protein [Halieaceae bacterium]
MEDQRPTPLVEDLEGTREKLAAWLSQRQGTTVAISDLQIPESTGMSNVTLLFDASWESGGEAVREACVGRLQPQIERPVFRDYDLTLQYRIMDVLGRETDIPVPVLRGLETDPSVLGVPFYVMKKTEGRIPTDMPPYNMDGWLMHETSLEQREQLWNVGIDVLARFHQLDHEALGINFLDDGGTGTPLQRQLAHWRGYHDWALEGRQHAICTRALDWLEANQPVSEMTRLCWGDARIGNIIFTADCSEVAAVLDWEMAVIGNPVQDLAWYCFIDNTFADGLGLPRLEGLPSYDDSVARWQAATGYRVDDFQYYWIFAGMRYGLILSRIMMATGQEQEIQENFVCKLLERNLDAL